MPKIHNKQEIKMLQLLILLFSNFKFLLIYKRTCKFANFLMIFFITVR